tara:strand:- start:1453 stop:2490 length:1038 start_codon:yes stop_codon:yes gene_type:complete
MIEDGREYKVYINYSLLNFPKIISKLLPFVLFFSIYFILSKYETNNELIIFWNFGENKIQFINFIIRVSFFLFLFQLLLTSLIVPKSQDKARSFLRNSNIDFLGNFIKPKRFNDTMKGVTIYSEKKDQNGVMYNLYIKKNIDNGFELTYAKKGIFEKKNTKPILILYEGETVRSKDNKITNFNFSKSDFLLANINTNTITQQKTQEMDTKDIILCITQLYKLKFISFFKEPRKKIINCTEPNKLDLLKELYKRLIVPFYIPLLMLVPYFLILSSKEKINYSKLKLLTFLIGVMIIIFSEGIIRFVSKELMSNLYILLAPFFIFIIFYLILIYKLNFRNIQNESLY